MDIHKPKAAHSWREFLIEIGTIICGILIALGLEQAIDTMHWSHKLAQTTETLKLELTEDNGPQAFERMAISPCLGRQLHDIASAVGSGAERRSVAALVSRYQPPSVSWDSEAWRAALASDVGSHTSAEKMIVWSSPYRLIPQLNEINQLEGINLEKLQVAEEPTLQLSPVERDRISQAVFSLRHDDDWMVKRSRTFLRALHDADLDLPSAKQQSLLAGLTKHFGSCVVTPEYVHHDPYDILSAWAPVSSSAQTNP